MKSSRRTIQFLLCTTLLLQFQNLDAQVAKCWTYLVIFKGVPNKTVWSDARSYKENTIYISNILNLCETDVNKIRDLKTGVIDRYELREGEYEIYFGVVKTFPTFPYNTFYSDKLVAVQQKNELSGLLDDAMKDDKHMHSWAGRFIIPAKTTIEKIIL
jgi:hypothetical protein